MLLARILNSYKVATYVVKLNLICLINRFIISVIVFDDTSDFIVSSFDIFFTAFHDAFDRPAWTSE